MNTNALREHISEIIKKHGVSLTSGGSREPGLSSKNAIRIVELLIQLNQPIFGIELWRSTSSGAYNIRSLDGWYSQSEDAASSAIEALEFLRSAAVKEGDLVTIQSAVSL